MSAHDITWRALFGLAPPRRTTQPERLAEIAAQQRERLAALKPDAVVVYDIQDEGDRNAAPRPFPFLPTVDPTSWATEALATVEAPRITYKSVPAQTRDELTRWLEARGDQAAVLVGAPSRRAQGLSLTEAYALARARAPNLRLGGVAIPERHHRAHDEHLRMLTKTARGCRFFVTQAVYDVHGSLSVLSDYALELKATGGTPVPIFFTFSPCGSEKTVEFMKWLGVAFPRWLENELRHASDILERSSRLCERNFHELVEFARDKRLPIGFNVESVSIRKAEIEAATALFHRLKALVS